MTTVLPVIADTAVVVEPDTGELVAIKDASDRALIVAADQLAAIDAEIFARKRALAAELRDRHGVGTTRVGGYRFKIAESQSWPAGATHDALEQLLASGAITLGDAERAMPAKPAPDTRALNVLAARLTKSNPDAARILARACTTSPPSLREITRDATDAQ